MITWQQIDDVLGERISSALTEAGYPTARISNDIIKPVARRSYRIDLYSTDDMGTECYAERGMDVEIYYYPQDKERPKQELNEISQLLKVVIRSGILVSGVCLELSEGIEADTSDGVLTLMFRLEWIETVQEEGEHMQELVLNEEEVVYGSNDA